MERTVIRMNGQEQLKELEQKLGYAYRDQNLLERALTHSSYANERQVPYGSNERLEFLGDSVLGFITADYFYRHFSHLPEGKLTKLRAATVCEKSLHGFALEVSLGKYLRLGHGEENTGGRERPSILADAFEAVIASIYLDGGIESARTSVLRLSRMRCSTACPSRIIKPRFKRSSSRIRRRSWNMCSRMRAGRIMINPLLWKCTSTAISSAVARAGAKSLPSRRLRARRSR